MSTGLAASFCRSVSLPLLAMLTSTSTADAAPGASIVAVDIAVLSLLSFLNDDDDEDEKGGPSQLDLALEKENNVITMRSSGWRRPTKQDLDVNRSDGEK